VEDTASLAFIVTKSSQLSFKQGSLENGHKIIATPPILSRFLAAESQAPQLAGGWVLAGLRERSNAAVQVPQAITIFSVRAVEADKPSAPKAVEQLANLTRRETTVKSSPHRSPEIRSVKLVGDLVNCPSSPLTTVILIITNCEIKWISMPEEMYRQGDLLVVKIPKLPKGKRLKKARTNVILRGEVTGHAHELIGGDLLVDTSWRPEMFIKIEATGKIVHEEHDPITLPKGFYKVVRQREYMTGYVRE
jgi:hypothetical protein